jgi:hypothetical protein
VPKHEIWCVKAVFQVPPPLQKRELTATVNHMQQVLRTLVVLAAITTPTVLAPAPIITAPVVTIIVPTITTAIVLAPIAPSPLPKRFITPLLQPASPPSALGLSIVYCIISWLSF